MVTFVLIFFKFEPELFVMLATHCGKSGVCLSVFLSHLDILKITRQEAAQTRPAIRFGVAYEGRYLLAESRIVYCIA